MKAKHSTLGVLLLLAGGAVATFAAREASAQTKRPVPPDGTPVHTTESGLQWSVLRPGAPDGARPELGDQVRVHYTGWLTDGTQFDSSHARGEPATFRLGEVIQGWNEGLALMTEGASHKLTIPFDLAYGEAGRPPTIPARATLIFEVELLAVIQAPKPPKPPPFEVPDPEKTERLESGIVFQVLEAGVGDPPRAEDTWVLDYAVWTPEGELIDFSGAGNGPLRANSTQVVMSILRDVPLRMRKGGVVVAEVPPGQSWGGGGNHPPWAQNPTIWRLEMLDILLPLPLPPFEGGPDPVRIEELDGGLVLEVLTEGDGATPGARDLVEVHYAGWLAQDGTLFDSSYQRGEPAKFRVNQVISGWTRGLQRMKVGTVARLRIPSGLGYGRRGNPPTIPPSADLVFHVELLGVER